MGKYLRKDPGIQTTNLNTTSRYYLCTIENEKNMQKKLAGLAICHSMNEKSLCWLLLLLPAPLKAEPSPQPAQGRNTQPSTSLRKEKNLQRNAMPFIYFS